MVSRCKPSRRKTRRLNLAVDAEVFNKFHPVMRENFGDSISGWVEYAMECYSRESCDGCPYAEEEGQQKISIGKAKAKAEEGG